MDVFYSLEARNPGKNIYRFYKIWTWRDLFNTQYVHIHYGRIGTRGTRKVYSVESDTHAMRLIHNILKKRSTSGKRIGAQYKEINLCNTPPLRRGSAIQTHQCAKI